MKMDIDEKSPETEVEVGETSNRNKKNESDVVGKEDVLKIESKYEDQATSFRNDHFTESASSLNVADKSGMGLPVIFPENIEQIGGVTNDPSSSLKSTTSFVCRICLNDENPDKLISPCMCKGTMSYVHTHCLEHWISTSGIVRCELCQFEFRTEHTLRYSVFQSLRVWYGHPNNRGSLQTDLLITTLLSLVTFGLVGISMTGLQYYVSQGARMGISDYWTYFSMVLFLALVVFVYIVNLYLIIKSQLQPWYRWWKSAKVIKLVLQNRISAEKVFGNRLESILTASTVTANSSSDPVRVCV